MNLNKLLQNWQRPRRARTEDHMTHCVDLMRTYLMRACDPPAAVRAYACRLTGMNAKDEELISLPEEFVSVLVYGARPPTLRLAILLQPTLTPSSDHQPPGLVGR
ncbi:hypothetical protein Aduo_001650 [Ancylostoma duodenale]